MQAKMSFVPIDQLATCINSKVGMHKNMLTESKFTSGAWLVRTPAYPTNGDPDIYFLSSNVSDELW